MTKPSNFIINTDYLSIAQTGSNNYTVSVPAGSIAVNDGTLLYYNFSAQAVTGAVDRVLISKDGGRYYIGSYRQISPSSDIYGFISVYRTSATNIRAQVYLQNYSATTQSYPAITFNIKISSFAPPNVF